MARFFSELTLEQLRARFEMISGEIPLRDGKLWVERVSEERFSIIFRADGDKRENSTVFNARIMPGKKGGSMIRGRCGYSLLVNALLAIPTAAILFLILLLLSLRRRYWDGIYDFCMAVQSTLGTGVSIALLCGSLYGVCFLTLLSMDINVREQANREIIYGFLRHQICSQPEIKERK